MFIKQFTTKDKKAHSEEDITGYRLKLKCKRATRLTEKFTHLLSTKHGGEEWVETTLPAKCLPWLSEHNGRWHTQILEGRADTGRMSSCRFLWAFARPEHEILSHFQKIQKLFLSGYYHPQRNMLRKLLFMISEKFSEECFIPGWELERREGIIRGEKKKVEKICTHNNFQPLLQTTVSLTYFFNYYTGHIETKKGVQTRKAELETVSTCRLLSPWNYIGSLISKTMLIQDATWSMRVPKSVTRLQLLGNTSSICPWLDPSVIALLTEALCNFEKKGRFPKKNKTDK